MSRYGQRADVRRGLGFTLIEVAVVVAIIAALMTFGLTFLNAQITSNANNITKTRANLIKDALTAYLGANRRLPCPIVPTGVAVTGVAPDLTGTPALCPSAFGVIPYATLGLSRDVAQDGWGNLFSYQVHADTAPTCPGTGRNWGNANCFGEGKGAGLIVNDGTLAAPITVTSSALATVISHGPNGLGAYVVEGTRNANPTTCEEAQNAHISIVATPACPGLPAESAYVYFKGELAGNDDIVTSLTPQETIQTLAKQGTLKTANARMAEDFEDLFQRTLGANLTTASCINDPTPPIQLDPWGTPYSIQKNAFPLPIFCIHSTSPNAGACDPANCTPAGNCRGITKDLLDTYRNRTGTAGVCP